MKAKKYKHLTFEDRCVIEEFLNHGYNFTQIANRLSKNRTTIAKEVYKHRFLRGTASDKRPCCFESKRPYVCNYCNEINRCKKQKYTYNAHIAYNEYKQTLISEREHLNITKEQIASINEIIAPLMIYKNHSINQIYASHPELLPFSKVTFYKYIDLGILNVRNIDLQRKVRWKLKKEYDYHKEKTDTSIKVGRFYTDFKDYLEYHPNASIVEMDTVIGTQGGKGGTCFLTLLFRQYNFILIYLMPYKKAVYVTEIFNNLKELLGIDEFKRVFEVILTDNGTEFSDPDSIEIDFNTGEKIASLFYCDPNCSWQKGSIEKNHEYIRYILPKGKSFDELTQEKVLLMINHINNTTRPKFHGSTPMKKALQTFGKNAMEKLELEIILPDDVCLKPELLK